MEVPVPEFNCPGPALHAKEALVLQTTDTPTAKLQRKPTQRKQRDREKRGNPPWHSQGWRRFPPRPSSAPRPAGHFLGWASLSSSNRACYKCEALVLLGAEPHLGSLVARVARRDYLTFWGDGESHPAVRREPFLRFKNNRFV